MNPEVEREEENPKKTVRKAKKYLSMMRRHFNVVKN